MRWTLLGTVSAGLTFLALSWSPTQAMAQESPERHGAFEDVTEPAQRPVRLYVLNHNFLDVNVYAIRGGSRYRLGSVRSHTGEFLEIPIWATQGGFQVRLQASPIGAPRSATTEPLQIHPGDIVEWRIENNLDLSSLAVWST